MSKKTHRGSRDGSKFEKIKDIAKKINENEKRKSDNRKKEKQNKPKGYRARKAGVISFWILLVLMFLIVVVNTGGSGKKPTGEVANNAPAASKAVSSQAIEFSKDFLSEYFTWHLDGFHQNERDAKLGYFVTGDIADQVGKIDSKKWHSTLKREAIVLKDLENMGDNKSLLTFQVGITFDKTMDAINKEKDELEEDEKVKPVEEVSPGTMDMVLNEQGIVKRIIKKKYVAVQLYYDTDTERFVVYQIPSFTYFDETPNESSPDLETNGLRSVTGNQSTSVRQFLDTFFESYANDSKEKLSYLMDDKTHQNGLNKTMEFVTVKNANIFEGKTDKEKVISANVVYVEPDTGIEFTSHYLLVLLEKEDRFVVKHINNKKYIDDLLNKAELEKNQKEQSTDIEELKDKTENIQEAPDEE
ncbi:hypothetical protein ACA30_13155 [Virgibacillus soli]|nr:hypothetical protein ACA30_13155 [Virgibacillus soli]